MRTFDHSRLPLISPVFAGESSHRHRATSRSFTDNIDCFRWVNGGWYDAAASTVGAGALVVIDGGRGHAPRRGLASASFAGTLQYLSAAMPVGRFHLSCNMSATCSGE